MSGKPGTGIERIAAERQRQITAEGWTPKHDAMHSEGELAQAAACYATPVPIRAQIFAQPVCGCREAMCAHSHVFPKGGEWVDPWPFEAAADKRKKHDRIRQLEIAGALIAAEIDRLQAGEIANA